MMKYYFTTHSSEILWVARYFLNGHVSPGINYDLLEELRSCSHSLDLSTDNAHLDSLTHSFTHTSLYNWDSHMVVFWARYLVSILFLVLSFESLLIPNPRLFSTLILLAELDSFSCCNKRDRLCHRPCLLT